MRNLTNLDKVALFHKCFDVDINEDFNKDNKIKHLRAKLILEECDEVLEELTFSKGNVKNLAKELADLLYVVYGTAVSFGIPLDEVFNKVHENNMSKLGPDGKPIKRKDGKILKPKDYKKINTETLW